MKARERFIGLLCDVNLDPDEDQRGEWLLKLFDRLQPDYTPGKCLGGHDMNTHVLFMVILALEIRFVLKDLGCEISHLIAAILLHNLDRVFAYKTTREEDPDGKIFHGRVHGRMVDELYSSPFESEYLDDIRMALENHSQRYDETKGTKLQRRLQQLDMISRFNPMCLMVAAAHHGSYAEFVNLDKPWLADMDPQTRFSKKGHSVYTILIGDVLVWYTWLPEDVRPLADRYLPGYIAAIRSLGPLIAEITGGDNRVETDIRLALGDELYARFA